ncbi:MAG: 16S rRNA (guanine(527)-N(7))-methyltransferase RsmG [Gammaproteobacteria bacterium]|jgi:16S rRNA (guanine527-N7)-methyltransferase|nr:16S rRNA (guanine(527)-N(7))-methyltransferase RsmG [Gammaproteobacteria bacterium]
MKRAAEFPRARVQAALQTGLAALNPGLDTAALSASLNRFLEELHRWNHAYNLTAVRDPLDMVSRHILDSYSVLPWAAGQRVIDVGTGAGLPGIALALARPDQHFTLLDANGKKVRFVTHAAAQLALANVRVVQARVEAFTADPFDTVICRAFTALPDFVTGAAHLVAPEGALIAMKGRYPEQEVAALPPDWRVAECAPVEVPGLIGERHILVLRRTP